MPKKSQPKPKRLSERERLISERLRFVRQGLGLTQAQFADELKITRARLSTYEDARVPIRWEIALRLCSMFLVSEKWLATGEGSTLACADLWSSELYRSLSPGIAFSQAYDEQMKDAYDARLAASGGFALFNLRDDLWELKARNVLGRFSAAWIAGAGREHVSALVLYLANRGFWFADFLAEHHRAPTAEEEQAALGGAVTAPALKQLK